MDEIELMLQAKDVDYSKVIELLKSKRYINEPDVSNYENQVDPLLHDVMDRSKRKDKWVKIDPDDPETRLSTTSVTSGVGGDDNIGYKIEPVARVALAIQKLIVKRAVSFLFGNPVELESEAENEKQVQILKALKRALYDSKSKSINRKVARNLFSCTEVAELWYPVAKNHNTYGFKSKFKLRCSVLSPLNGDKLYPYFDETGDMVAFSREFKIEANGKSVSYFETYTVKEHILWIQSEKGYELVDGYPKPNVIGKIPVVFASQPAVEWADVQNLIDRLEKLLSNFADTNDYHASPKIVVNGELKGFAKKGEAGGILQLDENSKASYLAWQNAPESVKLEVETLLKMIYTITQTPDISFDAVKGISSVSGIALKLLFMDAHLKVADHQEVFDEYLQRRINIIKAFIGKFNTSLSDESNNLFVEPVIKPYMITDEAAEMKIWQDANGGNPVMSQKASFIKAGLTNNPDDDYEQYKKEKDAESAFSFNEPTQV